MKKILVILIITTLFAGCNDFLDVDPVDRISETAVWSDENLVQAYVNAQYDMLQEHWGNYLHAYADEHYSTYNPSDSWSFRQNTLESDDIGLSEEVNFWETGYSYLHNINLFFEKIDDAAEAGGFDADNVLSMKAEMRFLRAYIYQIFLYTYGGVPIIETVYELDDDFSGVTRSTYQEVYDYIMDDLDFVIANMVDKQTDDNWGRASADVARAMKSRITLRHASAYYNTSNDLTRWQDAADVAWELIESERYSLWTGDYAEMFYTLGHNEAIWQKQRDTENSTYSPYWSCPTTIGGWGNNQPSENLSQAFEMQATGLLPYTEEGSLNPTITPSSGFDSTQYWVGRDPRWYSLFGYNEEEWSSGTIYTWDGVVSQDATYTGYYCVKFLDPSSEWSFSYPYTTPYTIYRYAEILLNYAEAQYELGYEDDARDYLNMVREREGVDMPAIKSTVTGTDLRDAIRHERRVEFPYEGLRFYDIRRWGIAEEVMEIPLIGMLITKVGEGDYDYSWSELLPGYWDDKYYLMPIPYDELQRSDFSITQNPGYLGE